MSEYAGGELTPIELDVLRMIVSSMSDREIAFALDTSEDMVNQHVQNIIVKTGASDRASASLLAIELGLIRTTL